MVRRKFSSCKLPNINRQNKKTRWQTKKPWEWGSHHDNLWLQGVSQNPGFRSEEVLARRAFSRWRGQLKWRTLLVKCLTKGERIRIIFPPSGLQVSHILLLNPAEMSTIVMVTRPDIGLRFHQGTSMHRWLIKEKTRTLIQAETNPHWGGDVCGGAGPSEELLVIFPRRERSGRELIIICPRRVPSRLAKMHKFSLSQNSPSWQDKNQNFSFPGCPGEINSGF